MPLNKAQAAAVDHLTGPLLVIAGPGTGKTQLLSAKVAHILEATDTNPENILCLTFTDSGATNMRTRLASMVGAKAAGKIHIHTYHAFGSDILAQYKNYATTLPRQFDAAIDAVVQYKIINTIQSKLPALDILKNANVADIIDTISSAKSARLSAKDLQKIAETNLKDTEKINPVVNKILSNLKPGTKFAAAVSEIYQPLLEQLTNFISPKPIVGQVEKEVNFLVRELNQIINDEGEKAKPSVRPLSSWKDRSFEKDTDGNYRLKNLVANKKLLSLSQIMAEYDQYLNEHGLFDFADMIEEAIKALKADRGFQLTLEERYQYILLDEFQDTNPSQFELIKLLTDYDSPNIMAVGDDDQAIFAFQGANASNLIDFQNYYHADKIVLTENYRSTQEILDFSHHISDQISDSFAKTQNIEKNLTAVRQKSTGTHIYRHEFVSADAEYLWVAEQISTLIANGEAQSSIAIITPKHKYIPPLLSYLRAFPKLHISYEQRENILEYQPIHQLLTLARFVFEMMNEKQPSHRLLEILSFPFWGITPLTAIQAVQQTKEQKDKSPLEFLQHSDDAQLNKLANFLANLVTVGYDTPLELFLDYLVGSAPLGEFRSPYLSYYAKQQTDFETFNLYENLSVLREHLKSYTNATTPKLADLISFLDDYAAAGISLVNTSPYQDSSDAVQILSAHKAKGLEFKHVFLISTDNLSWGKAKGNNNLLSLPKNLISIRHTGITDDERLRLFFVAITRAELSLTITNSIKDYSGKTPERLEYLEESENDQHEVISPFLPEPKVILHYDTPDTPARLAAVQTNWISAYQKLDGELRPILQKRLENYRLTATDLVTFIDIVYAGPLEFYKRKVLRAPSEPATSSIQFGNLIHNTFEAVTNQHLTNDEAIEFFKNKASIEALSADELDQLMDKGLQSLQASLSAFDKILRHPNAKAEIDFYHEHLTANNVPITGKIDHINIDESTKTIEVYDFKTGGYHAEKWFSHATLLKYALQLGFYKLLLNSSPTYSKYHVTKAHILFVSPDAIDNKVYDKVYEYSEKDEAELKKLIAAVYTHIKTLDYLDNPDLALSPDNARTLKDIKTFMLAILAQNQ